MALKAQTIWAGYQHFEEKSKGSIEVGKLADLARLDQNPLTVDPLKIAGLDAGAVAYTQPPQNTRSFWRQAACS